MSEDTTATFALPPQLAAWLEPLEGEPCGPDLEYDPEMLELVQAAAGRPETQFAAAQAPDWQRVQELCESLFLRTRDLRVAQLWGRAQLKRTGFAALPLALALLRGLIDQHWDRVHPLPDPDDGDTVARASILAGLDKVDSLLGDVRQSLLVSDRRVGDLRVRDVEIAMERLTPRADEVVRTQSQITGLLSDLPDLAQALREQCAAATELVRQLMATMAERFGAANTVETKTLRGMLGAIEDVLPALATEGGRDEAGADAGPRRGGGVRSVDSRDEALRAIELVCAYLERAEPTNPAQLLLRRAARLINKDFMQLMRELAPEALTEVARIMGVDPDTIVSSGSG